MSRAVRHGRKVRKKYVVRHGAWGEKSARRVMAQGTKRSAPEGLRTSCRFELFAWPPPACLAGSWRMPGCAGTTSFLPDPRVLEVPMRCQLLVGVLLLLAGCSPSEDLRLA